MGTLSRYTSIPALLDTLLHRRITLLSPKQWTDQNDREVMGAYEKAAPGRTVFAYCMAEGKETAHHWQVFADRGQGACIKFSQQRLLAAISCDQNVSHGPISYVQWRNFGLSKDSRLLPFIKRSVFRFEQEYRLVAATESPGQVAYTIPIPLDCITSVYISGELPPSLFDTVKSIIHAMPDCRRLPVRHSGLLNNLMWSKSLSGLLSEQQHLS